MISSALDRVRGHPLVATIANRLHLSDAAWPSPPIDLERGTVRQAAVAVVIRLGMDEEPELLFVARAEYAGDPWSAHVAFPGGRAEPHDPSPVATAMRETWEEIGVQLAGVSEVMGALPAVTPRAIRLPAIQVRPVVFIVGDLPDPVLGPEVRAAFWVPLRTLAMDERWRPTQVDASGATLTVPAFIHGEYVIWGLTARIIRSLIELYRSSAP